MAFLVGGDAVGIVDLIQRADGLQAVVHHQHLQAARRADIIGAVRTADDASYGVGRQAVRLVQDVDDLFADDDGQPVVVGADPQAAFLVYIEAVDIFDGLVIVYPAELAPVIAVQAGIGADPQHAVVGLHDVVGLAAGQAVGTAVNALDIVVVVGGRSVRPGGHGGIQREKQDQHGCRCAGLPDRFLALPAQTHTAAQGHQPHGCDGHDLVGKFDGKLPQQAAREQRPALFKQIVDHPVAPDVAGISVGEHQVHRHGNQQRHEDGQKGGLHEAVEGVKPVPARRDPDDHAEGYGGDGVCGREGMDRAVCQTRCQPHHRPAHGAAGISAQGGAERVCPQRQIQRDGRQPAADVQAYAQGRKQNDLPGFPIFQTFQPPPLIGVLARFQACSHRAGNRQTEEFKRRPHHITPHNHSQGKGSAFCRTACP